MLLMCFLAGEKPYRCRRADCGRRFARVSDLRSHERTHNCDAKAFVCSHPGCGKRFTRPYDLRKHEQNQHKGLAPGNGDDGTTSSTIGATAKRPIAAAIAPEVSCPDLWNAQPLVAESVPPRQGHASAGLLSDRVEMQQQQQQRQQHANLVRRTDILPPIVQPVPPLPSDRAMPTNTYHRKRIRCDAHKHCDSATAPDAKIGDAAVNVELGGGPAAVRQQRGAEDGVTAAGGEGKAHVHGASCGHVAVLHEDHVDFLVEGGQLECYDGREVQCLRAILFFSPAVLRCIR